MKIPVVNFDDQSQTIVQGTKFGTIEEAKELRDAEEADSSSPNLKQDKDQKKSEVIGQLMKNLPEELTDEQRSHVRKLLEKTKQSSLPANTTSDEPTLSSIV